MGNSEDLFPEVTIQGGAEKRKNSLVHPSS